MKKILCYGDSNVFGFNPENGKRYNENLRWSGILKIALVDFEVLEFGMNNRVGFYTNSAGDEFSAKYNLENVLNKYEEIEILILAIGTNDLQFQYNLDFEVVKSELLNLINLAKKNCKNVILIPPVKIRENILKSYFSSMFDEYSIEKSRKMTSIYFVIARENNCKYFDFNEMVEPSEIDGLHYSIESHRIIAENLAKFIKKIEK